MGIIHARALPRLNTSAVGWKRDAPQDTTVANPSANRAVILTCVTLSRALAAALPLALAFAPSLAIGQVQHVVSTYENENGLKVGEGRLHPYFDFETHYDSAAVYFDSSTGSVLKAEAIAHFRPGIRLDVPMTTSAISLDANVDYLWYTGLVTPGSSTFSRVQAAADASANFNQGSSVEVDITDHFARSDRTANAGAGVGVLSLLNDARLQLPLRPGGRALEIVPNAGFAFESFKPLSSLLPVNCNPGDINCDPSSVSRANYQNFSGGLDARWRFLPKTAFTFESRIDTRSYSDSTVNPSSLLLKASTGLAGLISTKLATVLKVGWGQDLQSSGAHTLIALAELNYLLNETSNVRIGYLRDVQLVPLYGTYRDDRGYVDARFFLHGRLNLHGTVALDRLSFYSASGRQDTTVTVDVGPEYQFTRWLIGAAGYVVGSRTSTFTASSYNFTRHEVYVRATFIY